MSSCDPGLVCSPNKLCVACSSDLKGCPCSEQNTCGDGLVCEDDTCQRDPALGVRLVDQCYTPCRNSLVKADGTIRGCSSDGMMRGCVGGAECVEGSCVQPGNGPRACQTDMECPGHQSCQDGQCYSTCETNNDCGGDNLCHRHVCRTPCSLGGEACRSGDYCDLVDGSTGFCLPLSRPDRADNADSQADEDPSDEDPSDEEPRVFSEIVLSRTSLGLNPARRVQTFRVENIGEFSETLLLRKKRHTIRYDTGEEVVERGSDTELLPWLEMGVDERFQGGDELEFTLEPGERVELAVRATDEAPDTWDAMIELLPADGNQRSQLRPRQIFLNYASAPEGRWQGKAMYFAHFGTNGLDDWLAQKSNEPGQIAQSNVNMVANAFVRKWRGFLVSQFSGTPEDYERLLEVVQATTTESWKLPSVRELCKSNSPSNEERICYLSGVADGYQFYSTDPNGDPGNPVPFGVNELPVALNLQVDDEDTNQLVGRIDTAGSLHYPGNPSVEIGFTTDPSGCANGSSNPSAACVAPMKTMRATSVLSGRYPVNDRSEGCSVDTEFDRGFEMVGTPWVVPGFEDAVEWDPQTQQYFRYECRGSKYPYGPGESCSGSVGQESCTPLGSYTEAEIAENQRLTQANPVPDGLQRVRRMELVDGAMINNKTMFVIFRERMENFMAGTDDADEGQDFEVYGFMMLERQDVDLDSEAFEGTDLGDAAPVQAEEGQLTYQCSENLLQTFTNAPQDADLGDTGQVGDAEVRKLVQGVMSGRDLTGASAITYVDASGDTQSSSSERVHYLCRYLDATSGEVYGFFDTGSPNSSSPECPESAEVTFFTLDAINDSQLESLSCNSDQSCHLLFEQWERGVVAEDDFGDGTTRLVEDVLRTDPYWECNDVGARSCAPDRTDLRNGKTFYGQTTSNGSMAPLQQTIEEAFRYRTQFVSSSGQSIGFAPDICAPNPNNSPYCYDPLLIEEVRERVDCLSAIYNQRREALRSNGALDALGTSVRDYLRENFSYKREYHLGGDPNAPQCLPGQDSNCQEVLFMGFERLYAELLIVLADEAYTDAFASRFDLAGSQGKSFDGQAFEGELGINLSGPAGYEMYSLYQSIQYYQLVLDRFYSISNAINYSLEQDKNSPDAGRQNETFIRQEIVTLYFDRLIRASTQKARAWSEVAKKYASLNRPELARQVAERGYVATYQESIVFSRLMDSFVGSVSDADRAQIFDTMVDAQRRYRMGLLDMRRVYADINDNQTIFGLAPDYIPFPVLGPLDANGFERALSIAQSKVDTAADKEQIALESNRSKKTDMAEFQDELQRLKYNYENQLSELCGTVEGADGTIYPAIPKYSEYFKDVGVLKSGTSSSEQTRFMRQLLYQDPCGRFGTGELYEARKEAVLAEFDFQVAKQNFNGIKAAIDEAENAYKEKCVDSDFPALEEWATWKEANDEVTSLADKLNRQERGIRSAERVLALAQDELRAGVDCTDRMSEAAGAGGGMTAPGQILNASTLAGAACTADIAYTTVAHVAFMSAVEPLEQQILDSQADLSNWETKRDLAMTEWEAEWDCEVAEIEKNEQVANLVNDTLVSEIEVLRSLEAIELARSRVRKVQARAERLRAEYDEAAAMSIDLEAARNDPNVRIYKNDAVITADRTFDSAIKSVYKATRVFEYYTGQSYADLEKLFLVRMISAGDYDLAGYLRELEDAYIDYQEQFGEPDLRLQIKSLRDDIFMTELYGEDGVAQSQGLRDDDFQEMLNDSSRLDDNGYISIPFPTSLRETSPLTHNHKISYLQAEIVYDGQTDVLARVYLRQVGTGTVQNAFDENQLYLFPERTAVINPFFNGTFRQLGQGDISSSDVDAEIFRNGRLRDRPLVNTRWELVLNMRDEQVNEDLDPTNIKDIRLYMYYTDYTNL